MRWYPIVGLGLSLSLSCTISCVHTKEPIEMSFQQVLQTAVNSSETTRVLVCDFRQYNIFCRNRTIDSLYRATDWNLLYSDISLPENRELQNIFLFERLPAIISITSLGVPCAINYLYNEFRVLTEEEQKIISVFLKGYYSLSSNPDESIFSLISSDSLYSNNLYSKVLLARYYASKNEPKVSSSYWKDVIETYEANPERVLEKCYVEALTNTRDSLPHVLFSPLTVNLGSIPVNFEVQKFVTISNMGKGVYVLADVRPSCSCVQVSYPLVIPAGCSDTLKISYRANSDRGAIDQNIYINQSVRNTHKTKITIIGNKI